jgi:hypothetical protein
MFSKIKAFFVRVEHDVEAIIANFTDTVTKLEAAAVAKAKQADDAFLHSMRLSNEADRLKAEGARAQDVADKIKALVA